MPAVVKRSAPDPKPPSEQVQDEALSVEDVDLSDAPKLRPYNTLRMRERARILSVVETGTLKDEKGEPRPPTMAETLEFLALMDEAMEFVAVDMDAYLEWLASPKGGETGLSALFMRYAEQVGNSIGSAN